MKKYLAYAIAAFVVIGAISGYRWLRTNRLPNFGGEAEVYVKAGATPDDVIAQISGQTKILSERNLRRAFRDHEVAKHITPGHYLVRAKYSSVYVARMLNNGWEAPVKVTVSDGLRLKPEIAERLGAQLLLETSDILAALNDDKFLKKYGFNSTTVYALFIPDTYEMYWTASMDDLFARMKKAYDAFWTEERLGKAKARGLSKMDVSIIASIVKGESNYTPEYPKLAGVYLNRLKKGMRLQACPTVAFVYDYKLNRVLDKHLQVNSPYNTYRHDGLPPGPICCPTKAALDAVLNAETKQGYLYFCANADFSGTHKFASTYNEHLKNGREFQAELDRRAAAKRAAKDKS